MYDTVLINMHNKNKWYGLEKKSDFVNWALDKYLDEYLTGQVDGEPRVDDFVE